MSNPKPTPSRSKWFRLVVVRKFHTLNPQALRLRTTPQDLVYEKPQPRRLLWQYVKKVLEQPQSEPKPSRPSEVARTPGVDSEGNFWFTIFSGSGYASVKLSLESEAARFLIRGDLEGLPALEQRVAMTSEYFARFVRPGMPLRFSGDHVFTSS
jgi:hypothetical protein